MLIRRLFPGARLAEKPPAARAVEAVPDTAAETMDARRARLLVDAIDEGVLVVDANRRVVSANVAAGRILAVPTSRLLGRPLPEFGLGRSADGPVTAAFGGRPRSTVPVHVQDAQGTPRSLVVSARPLLELGKTVPTEVLVSFDDHTDRRRTESHYQALAASLPDVAVVVVGDDLRFTVATGTGLAAAGWRAEDLLGRTPAEVLGADRAKEITEAFRAALAGEHRVLQRPACNDRKRTGTPSTPRCGTRSKRWSRRWPSPATSPTRYAPPAGSSCCSTRPRSEWRSTARMDAGCRSTRRCARWSATAPRNCSPATSSRSPIPTTWTPTSSRCSACSPVRSPSTSWTSATSIATATSSGST